MLDLSHGLIWSGLLVGCATAAWSKIKLFLGKIWSLVFVEISVEGSTAHAVQSYCWNKFSRSPFGVRRYGCISERVRPLKRVQSIAVERNSDDPTIFWDGWKPLFISGMAELNPKGDPSGTINDNKMKITFIRRSFDSDKIIMDAMDRYNELVGNGHDTGIRRFAITRLFGLGSRSFQNGGQGAAGEATISKEACYDARTRDCRILKWDWKDIGPDLSDGEKAINSLAFPPQVMGMVEELNHWKKSETWYREKQIPWTRGWLLHGRPGTGKTSLIRAIAQDLDLPVFVFDLTSMSNSELTKAWNFMQNSVPCIALIEDIDAVFDGRDNKLTENGGGLTFDCLLNCLSGIENATGVFKVVTTNNIQCLDEALGIPRKDSDSGISTRPGRLDRAIELPLLDKKSRIKIAERILVDCPQYLEKIVNDGDGDSGAQFVERCGQMALAEFWKSKCYPQS